MRAMPIIRSRTGCFTCRRRKKKCNEEKPICSGCRRNKLECHWPTETCAVLQSRHKPSASTSTDSTQLPLPSPNSASNQSNFGHRRSESLPEATTINISPRPALAIATPATPQPQPQSRPRSYSNSSVTPSIDDTIDTSAILSSPIIELASPDIIEIDSNNALAMTLSTRLAPGFDASSWGVSPAISLLPSYGSDSLELLSHYLSRTANSMGNGSTDTNPFVAQLVPIAFSNPLVLQLILAQSASHRQVTGGEAVGNEVAQKYYTDSLRMFRNVVSEYMSGKEENTLVLTIGSLILSLTEVARGDIQGTIFDHLKASESMLTLLVNRPKSEVPSDLTDFLIEYYLHMTAASLISTDPRHKVPTLSPEIETLARGLVDRGYIGQLCGCWLELLVIIPQIFHLGQRMMSTTDNEKTSPSPDDIMAFGFLQSQIMAYFPDPSANHYSRLAGLVFKQAVLLYLWSILDNPNAKDGDSGHKNFTSLAVTEAVSILGQFPAKLRINTSLCWPLAVIGCCTSDPDVQQILRQRLQIMLGSIGLGNMRETLTLLEHVWTRAPDQVSPWKLSEFMQEHKIWISFA